MEEPKGLYQIKIWQRVDYDDFAWMIRERSFDTGLGTILAPMSFADGNAPTRTLAKIQAKYAALNKEARDKVRWRPLE